RGEHDGLRHGSGTRAQRGRHRHAARPGQRGEGRLRAGPGPGLAGGRARRRARGAGRARLIRSADPVPPRSTVALVRGGLPADLRCATVLLLAFDTATPAVTVALHDGRGAVAERSAVDARRHGELLAVAIQGVLADCGASHADLTAIAVGTGPGPYTGLRTGLVTARVVASDARRKEVYWARYSQAAARIEGPDVGAPAQLPAGYPVAGEGPVLYPEITAEPIPPRYPAAAQLAEIAAERLAAGAPARPADPLYLRRPDARVPGKPKRVTPW